MYTFSCIKRSRVENREMSGDSYPVLFSSFDFLETCLLVVVVVINVFLLGTAYGDENPLFFGVNP